MSEVIKIILDDPKKIDIMTTDMKEKIIKAAIATVNIMAAKARKEAVKNLQGNFTLRNTFSARQVQFTPMGESNFVSLADIQSIVGTTEKAPWLARQEEGGAHTPSRGNTLAIPTDVARGGSELKMVVRAMRVGSIKKNRRVHGESKRNYKSHKAWNVARAFVAHSKGKFLPLGGSGDQRNLHEVVAFQTEGKGKNRQAKFQTRQVYKFDLETTETEANPFLGPACEKVLKDMGKIFESQMKKAGL